MLQTVAQAHAFVHCPNAESQSNRTRPLAKAKQTPRRRKFMHGVSGAKLSIFAFSLSQTVGLAARCPPSTENFGQLVENAVQPR